MLFHDGVRFVEECPVRGEWLLVGCNSALRMEDGCMCMCMCMLGGGVYRTGD